MCDEIEDIKMIMMRDKKIEIFDNNRDKKEAFQMDEMINIECVIASHNFIRSIASISTLTTLRQLNLSFN